AHVARIRTLADQLAAPELRQAVDGVSSRFDAYYQSGRAMARAYVDQGPAGGNPLMPRFDAATNQITDALNRYKAIQTEIVARESRTTHE
ncbi:hypothetical protein C1Y23_34990, partial [Pseudomonas sp. GW460-12]